MWTQITICILGVCLVSRSIADEIQEYISKFRDSCWRESVVVEGKTMSAADAVPFWLALLDSKLEREQQEAARNLAVAAIGKQLSYSPTVADMVTGKYHNVVPSNDVLWEVKLNLLSVLSEIGDPKLKHLIERERKKGDPRLTRIVRLVESKQYLLPAVSGGVDVRQYIREHLGLRQLSGDAVIFQNRVISKAEAVKKMIEAFSKTDPEIVQQALTDWGRNPQFIKNTDAFDAVTGWFHRAAQLQIPEQERNDLREQIVALVGISGDPRAVQFLQKASQDESDDVRRRTERALQRLSEDSESTLDN